MSGINYSSVIKDLKISHRGILTWIQGLGGICVYVCACLDGRFVWLPLKPWVESVPIWETHVWEEWLQLQNNSTGKVSMFLFRFQMIALQLLVAHLKVHILDIIVFVLLLQRGAFLPFWKTTAVRAPTDSRSHPCKGGMLGTNRFVIWHLAQAWFLPHLQDSESSYSILPALADQKWRHG